MIDERQEELAALYALDLLEGAERTQFESALARDPALQTLVNELRDSSAALAHTAPAVPPPAALKERVLRSIDAASAPDNVARPPSSVFRPVLPWAIAAGFALLAAWLGQEYSFARNDNAILRKQQALTEVALQTAQTTLAAERVLAVRQLATITDTNRQLADATRRVTDLEARRQQIEQQLLSARALVDQRERELVVAKTQAAERAQEILALTQRAEALARTAAETNRQLAAAQQVADKLDNQLREQASVAEMKITTLASMLKNSPEALAVAVWDPKKQEGVLKFAKLPALTASQDYQLWVVDPQYANPVDGGLLTVDPRTGEGTITFKPKQPVQSIAAFAVTRERKGGVPKAEGPFVLLGK